MVENAFGALRQEGYCGILPGNMERLGNGIEAAENPPGFEKLSEPGGWIVVCGEKFGGASISSLFSGKT